MKGDAIKALVAQLGTDTEPTDEQTVAAINEGVDLVIGFAGAVTRIAESLATLAECVDDNCQPAFVVSALVAPPPSVDED